MMQHNMKKAMAPLVTVLLFALGAREAMAADPIEHQVELIASIPTAQFHVVPSQTGWIGVPQRLEWKVNGASGTLTELRKGFTLKSTNGAITAMLSDSNGSLYSDKDTIGLKVSIGGTELTTSAVEVVPKAAAAAGIQADMVIAAVTPATWKPGNYRGYVNMTFDVAAP